MCAWRYKAGGAGAAGGTGGSFGSVNTGLGAGGFNNVGQGGIGNGGTSSTVLGAGAFLRQNATTSNINHLTNSAGSASLLSPAGALLQGSGYQNENLDKEDEEFEEDEEMYDDEEVDVDDDANGTSHAHGAQGRITAHIPPLQLANAAGNGGFGQAQAPATSLAGTFLRNIAAHQQQSTAGGGLAAAAAASLRKPLLAGLSRQLFKDTDARGRSLHEEDDGYNDEDEYDDELDDMTAEDHEFVLNTRDLFDSVDPELLAEDFVPHEHVVGVIAADNGDEAMPEEIEDNLADYNELMEEIDMYLGNYIEHHHDEFNSAISDFSEMLLAVSGSDDTLARLKKELVQGAMSLDTHAEQLRVLRIRAAKSLFMKDTLQKIQDAMTAETEVKQLITTRHYLRAVQQLRTHRVTLQDEAMKQVRASAGLREYVESTMATLHSQIVDDLLSCVFRQEHLDKADAQLLHQMMREDDSAGGGGGSSGNGGPLGATAGAATNLSAPNVRHMVQKYWKRTGRHHHSSSSSSSGGKGGNATASRKGRGDGGEECSSDSEDDDDDNDNDKDSGARKDRAGKRGHRKRPRHTLAAIVETFYDDPSDDLMTRDYLKFIPLCVKSLYLLDKLDSCHEAFFSRATKCIERFIAHFLRLYDSWRRKIISGTTLAGSDGGATVRAIKIRAFDLTSDLVSNDEAVATVQARELRAMLSALFAELEKILRNADYLLKIVAVACFPFVSEFIVQPVPFDAEKTSREWDLMHEPLEGRVSQVGDIIAEAEHKVEDSIRKRLAKEAKRKSNDSDSTNEDEGVDGGGHSATSSTAPPPSRYTDAFEIWDQVKEFFSIEKMFAKLAADHTAAAPQPQTATALLISSRAKAETALAAVGGKGGSSGVPLQSQSPPQSAMDPNTNTTATATQAGSAPASCPFTLGDVITFVEEAIASTTAKYAAPAASPGADGTVTAGSTSGGYGYKDQQALRDIHETLVAEITDGVRCAFLQDVKGVLQQWDLHVLWSQLNYHVEFVFHVLCDAKEAEDEGDDLVTLAPFLRQKNLVSRVQRTAAILKDAESRASDEAPTLDKLLGAYQSSSGLLRMMEETGPISFSLIGAVKKAQADVRKANAGQSRQFQAMQSDTAKLLALSDAAGTATGVAVSGGVGGGNAPLVLLNASALRNWFVFTAMNVLTCYQCAERFCERCCDRVPEFRLLEPEESVLGFFKRFSRATYIPTLHAFHSQQLQQLCFSMGDTAEMVAASLNATDGSNSNHNHSSEASNTTASGNPTTAAPTTRAIPPATTGTATATTGGATAAAVWPTVTVAGAAFPILTCVYYVGQVLEKISAVCAVLPETLAEDVERSTSEALVEELAAFLKRKLQLLGRGTIQYRLLNGPFEDAFAAMPNKRWRLLCDEANMWSAHKLVDLDLYRYYQYNSSQRTSGHEYTRQGTVALEALSALDRDKDSELDEKIGLIAPQDLCVRDDSSLVALAVLSYSTEWLCEVLLRNLWPGARRYDDYTDSCVPGYLFTKQLGLADATSFPVKDGDTTAHQKIRLSSHLSRLCALAQVSLFYLSVEARFLSFCFLPQLRDESYNIIATSASADTFVQAYARRISKLYMLMRQHLSPKKIKFTCLTIGKPTSELVLLELAHLRDKAISEAGTARLRTDLLVLQTALQLILPTDLDVRGAVSRYFARPAVFVRYIPNRDVVNELLSSGDYRRFTLGECEELIRLVFRQVTGANDDSMARANIDLFYKKLKTMDGLRTAERRERSATASASGAHPSLLSTPASSTAGSLSSEEEQEQWSETESDDEQDNRKKVVAQVPQRSTVPDIQQQQQQSRSVSSVGGGRPPPLPLAQSSSTSAAAATAVPRSTAATAVPAAVPASATSITASAASPNAEHTEDGEDEEYEEEEETEEDEETDEKVVAAPVPPPRAAAVTAAVVPPIQIPTRPVSAAVGLPRTPAPAPVVKAATTTPAATAPAAAGDESSDDYYYEEVTDDEEEEEETEEEEEEVVDPRAPRRR